MHKALLTGVTGFIGSHLAEKLVNEHWELHAVVRESSNLDILPGWIRESVIFHVHSKEHDLPEIVEVAKPEVVFHLASLFLSQHRYQDIDALMESNVTFGVKLLEAMRQHGVHNFVHAGTAWQHYQNASYSPVNLYAASKQAFEDVLRYYEETVGIHAVVLKLFDTYGPGDRRGKLLALLEQIAETGETLPMSPGEQKIDYVHVDDVSEAFFLAANYLLEGHFELCGDYVVSSGHAISLRELVSRYEKIIGKRLSIAWGERAYREREVMVPWNKGRILPGWERKHKELM